MVAEYVKEYCLSIAFLPCFDYFISARLIHVSVFDSHYSKARYKTKYCCYIQDIIYVYITSVYWREIAAFKLNTVTEAPSK